MTFLSSLGCLEAPSKIGPDAHVIKLPTEDNKIWNAIQHLFNQAACLLFLPITVSGKAIGLIFSIINKLKAEDLSLEGKVVVVTGASSGLGEALAHSFYKEGCKLIIASRRYSELVRVRDKLLSSCYCKGKVVPPVIIQLDLNEMEKIQDVVNTILGIYGHVDILVNNAGVSYRGEICETASDVDSRIMNINYLGTVKLTKGLYLIVAKNFNRTPRKKKKKNHSEFLIILKGHSDDCYYQRIPISHTFVF